LTGAGASGVGSFARHSAALSGLPHRSYSVTTRVVATRVGGIPDVVSSSKLGELVPVQDIPALADALARVAYEPYVPEALTAAAPYGSPDSAARLRDVLMRAVAQRASRAP